MAEKTSNANFDKEPAEGSRETVEQSMDQQQGITNKSVADEQAEQAKLPRRGEAKKD